MLILVVKDFKRIISLIFLQNAAENTLYATVLLKQIAFLTQVRFSRSRKLFSTCDLKVTQKVCLSRLGPKIS
jgi:hypothetical protein